MASESKEEDRGQELDGRGGGDLNHFTHHGYARSFPWTATAPD